MALTDRPVRPPGDKVWHLRHLHGGAFCGMVLPGVVDASTRSWHTLPFEEQCDVCAELASAGTA